MTRIQAAQFRWMTFSVFALLAVGLSPLSKTASAEEHDLRTYSWQQLRDAGELKSGEIVHDDVHTSSLKVASPLKQPAPNGFPVTVPLFDVAAPTVREGGLLISGDVRYENVAGNAYLEMWVVFQDKSQYFSRTLGSAGPSQSIAGTSGWRNFQLPFRLSDEPNAPKPSRIVVNLVFPDAGTVWLSDVALSEFSAWPQGTPSTSWWSNKVGAIVGGLGGTLLGILGGIVGMLVSRGRARTIVLSVLFAELIIGAGMLVAGTVAAMTSQPYSVYYPLLLLGAMNAISSGVGLFIVRQRYADIELRRMQALDV